VSRWSVRREAVLGFGAYAVYMGVRAVVLNERGRRRAEQNARRVVALERRLGLDLEPRAQELFLGRKRVLALLNLSYVMLNVGLTVGWLALLFRRRHPEFHRLRSAAVLSILGSCPVFLLFPCAPPRSLDDFVDTVGTLVDMDGRFVSCTYNPIAAMPSIHLAAAVVTGAGLRQTARSPLVRGIGVVYPPAVFATVVVTANHYVLDGIAGSALAAIALRLAGLTARSSAGSIGPAR
jgi:hypothetical protein